MRSLRARGGGSAAQRDRHTTLGLAVELFGGRRVETGKHIAVGIVKVSCLPSTLHDLTPSIGAGQRSGPARKPAPNLVCGVATLQLWPETEASRPRRRCRRSDQGRWPAARPWPARPRRFRSRVLPGIASLAASARWEAAIWSRVTLPAGTGGSGAGGGSELDPLWQPARPSDKSAAIVRLNLEKSISTSVLRTAPSPAPGVRHA